MAPHVPWVGSARYWGEGTQMGLLQDPVVGQGNVPLNFSQWTVIAPPSRAHCCFAFVFLVPSMLPHVQHITRIYNKIHLRWSETGGPTSSNSLHLDVLIPAVCDSLCLMKGLETSLE